MELLNTPLPAGYEAPALFLRCWLLDLRLRVATIPQERQAMLEKTIYDCLPKRHSASKRVSEAKVLANAVR